MDRRTKELIEAAERHAELPDNCDVAEHARDDVPELCAIIREQAEQLELLASATKVGAGDTLVLVAHKGMDAEAREAAAGSLYGVHPSPIIILPHGWSTLPSDELRRALERADVSGIEK